MPKNKPDSFPKDLSKSEKEKYLKKWIKEIAKNSFHTKKSIKEHIIHHAGQIYERDPDVWAASMRNMTEIFEEVYKVKPSTDLRLDRLQNKYNKNKETHTPPPKK